MVRVPAGTFVMGPSAAQLDETLAQCRQEIGEQHWFCSEQQLFLEGLSPRVVYLDAFDLDRYEVTAAQFRVCVAAGECDVAALIAGDSRYLRADWPMVNVTWQDAVDYCAWAGKRLPTEAEWEKAARGRDRRAWPWGNQERRDGSNHGSGENQAVVASKFHGRPSAFNFRTPLLFTTDESDGYKHAAPPGALRWSISAYGAFDLAGNVEEWVADYFSSDHYAGLPQVNPLRDVASEGEDYRVARGGSWRQPKFFGRSFMRNPWRPQRRSEQRGFRCARAAE